MGPNTNSSFLRLEQRSRTWVYTTTFSLEWPPTGTYRLIFEGVKMGASIILDDTFVGRITDQFLRYEFNVVEPAVTSPVVPLQGTARTTRTTKSRPSTSFNTIRHTLHVVFDPKIPTNGRFMACSGGWDWAPYSRAGDERGSSVWSFGIFRPVYIIREAAVSIRYVAPKVYPIELNTTKGREEHIPTRGDFRVAIDVHLHASNGFPDDPTAHVVVRTDFGNETRVQIAPSTKTSMTVRISLMATQVLLWWPADLGQPNLYALSVSYQGRSGSTHWIRKRIGKWRFREGALDG